MLSVSGIGAFRESTRSDWSVGAPPLWTGLGTMLNATFVGLLETGPRAGDGGDRGRLGGDGDRVGDLEGDREGLRERD